MLSDIQTMLQDSSKQYKLRSDIRAAGATEMIQQQINNQIAAAGFRMKGGNNKKKGPIITGGSVGGGGDSTGPMVGINNLGSPIEGNYKSWSITTPYGPRIHPITGKPSFHTGLDIDGSTGDPIYAVSNGIVRRAAHNDPIYGNQVVLGMGHKWQTMYGHMSRLAVHPGQHVKRGQIIGYMGSTGLSTGSHLHYELWHKQNPVNPSNYYGRHHK